MFVILAYAPFLLCLPVLLLAGVVFFVVPGGFIIVLGGLYYVTAGFAGLLGLGANKRWQARASRAGRAHTTFANTPPAIRATSRQRGAIPANPVTVQFTRARVAGPARSFVPRQRGSHDVGPVGPLAHQSTPERLDGALPVESAAVAEALPEALRRPLPSGPARKDSFAPPSSGSEARA